MLLHVIFPNVNLWTDKVHVCLCTAQVEVVNHNNNVRDVNKRIPLYLLLFSFCFSCFFLYLLSLKDNTPEQIIVLAVRASVYELFWMNENVTKKTKKSRKIKGNKKKNLHTKRKIDEDLLIKENCKKNNNYCTLSLTLSVSPCQSVLFWEIK